MRIPFLGFILFCSFQLAAQKGRDPYYIQQAAPPEQLELDCYQRNLEEGLSAQKRGDCRQALRWFQDAQSCPEVLKTPEREAEIKNLIDQCTEKPPTVTPTKKANNKSRAPLPSSQFSDDPVTSRQRHFQPSRQFLEYDKPECFEVTCREAARAYAGGYWDDAAALYRAAKNCADADQAGRLEANRRVTACKIASQNELRKKEQEAVKLARHAIAANRANDANQLLRKLDRSLAYRLADFANEYIAPEDNDACRQAMFNAVYHTPSVHADLANDQMQIPFCYQLGDNLDSSLVVRFLGNGKSEKICAFAPSRHLLFKVDAQTLKPDKPIQLEDTTMISMDAVPDGRTLLFISPNAYLFWRSPKELFRLPVRQTALHCFSAMGRTFFYLEPDEMVVYALDLDDAFLTRKGRAERAAPEPTGIKVNFGIRQIAGGNGPFWLGYRDSIVVYSPQRNVGRLWGYERTFPLAYSMENYFNGDPPDLSLNPLSRTAVFANDTATVLFEIPEIETTPIWPTTHLAGRLLANSSNTEYIATYTTNLYGKDNYMYLFSPEIGANKYGALIPAEAASLELSYGAFSSDNHLLATTNSTGKLEVWMLASGIDEEETQLGPNEFAVPNADGSSFYFWRNDSIMRVPADQLNRVQQSVKAPTRNNFPQLIVQQDWVAYRLDPNTVVLTDQLGKQKLVVPSPDGDFASIIGNFSTDEQYFACQTGFDSVGVFNLKTKQLEAARFFGGPIQQVHFLPGTNKILVLHVVESDDARMAQTVWDMDLSGIEALRSVRLQQGYETREVALSETRGFIAFTDGIDIRVFRQNDLLDEIVRIEQYGFHMVTAMRFYPDGSMLAAGYEDGSVVFWNISNGLPRFSWAKRPLLDSTEITSAHRLRFTDKGRRLQIYLPGNRVLTKDLEVSLIRAGVQSDFRKLISFRPSQIREYDLAQALDYPNNFARLAASGDLPLIRSFFDYFKETALNSNNIQRVKNSCNRAATLFGQLDASTQAVLRPILLAMFEDYHWKLLLRNRVDDAQKVTDAMNRDFGNPIVAVRAAAHTALLRNDIRAAARQYADWALRSAESGTENGLIDQSLVKNLRNEVLQLFNYNLIREAQLNCLCDLFGREFDQHCKNRTANTTIDLLDIKTRLRWQIFQQLNAAQSVKNYRQRVQILEAALADTRLLQRQNPSVYQQTFETVLLALSKAYSDWSTFEQRSNLAFVYLQQANDYLSKNGTFQNPIYERERRSALAKYYLQTGDLYQNQDSLERAKIAYRQGLGETAKLLQLVESDQTLTQKYQDNLSSKLNLQIGLVALLQGNADAAKQAFEKAQDDKAEGIHRLYFGHVDLLDESETTAMFEYANIQKDIDLGQALFQIEEMARHQKQPTQRKRLLNFLQTMRTECLRTHPKIDATATDYHWAYNKINPFGAQAEWDSAFYWSAVASRLAQSKLEQDDGAKSTWQNNWLGAQLNQAYFLLFSKNRGLARYTQIIELSHETEQYFASRFDFEDYKYKPLIKTNLAHGYWLRNQAGDREQAIEVYKSYLESPLQEYDPWAVLLKDFRDLHAAGISFPDLANLIRQIRPPEAVIVAEDWKAMGIAVPE